MRPYTGYQQRLSGEQRLVFVPSGNKAASEKANYNRRLKKDPESQNITLKCSGFNLKNHSSYQESERSQTE